jgi:outer membrane cobalamin receptor
VAFILSLLRKSRTLSLLRLSLLLAFMVSCAIAQEIKTVDTLGLRQPDTLRTESFKKKSIPFIGYIQAFADSSSPLHSSQFLHSDATYVGDLLSKRPGLFLRDLGAPGAPGQLSAYGVDDRGIAILLDGRPLNDPITGGYNLYYIPIEYVDEIETVQGSGSLFEAPDAAGGTINFVTHQYDNSRPLTKFRFFQGVFEHILSDGVFAQNINRSMNAMFGFQRLVSDGRFPNSAYDSWNFRLRLRYNLSDRFNAWISEFYTKATVGLNGGVDPIKSLSIYDEVTAVAQDLTTYQIVSRHDFTLGFAARLLADSSLVSKGLVYYSSMDREYTNGGGQGAPPLFTDLQGSSFWGTKLEQRLGISGATIDLGVDYEQRLADQSHYLSRRSESFLAGSARGTLKPVDWLTGSFTSRFERLRGDNALSWGLNIETGSNDWFSVWGDYERSYRFPTIQELFWNDSTITRSNSLTKEAHSFSQVGVRFRSGPMNLSLAGFYRKVVNAIDLRPFPVAFGQAFSFLSTPVREFTGATADVRLQVWHFALEGNLTYTNSKDGGALQRIVPPVTSTGELSYRDRFVDGSLDLKIATRLRAVSHHDGLQFLPSSLAYAREYFAEMPGFAILDFYTVAKLGDAYLTFEWENPLDVNAMLVPYYPLLSRSIKLGVNWIFTD